MTAIDTDVREVQRMFNVNLFGPMRMVCCFHDMLIQSSGIIVNIGSVGGIVPYVYGCESLQQMLGMRLSIYALIRVRLTSGCAAASYNATKAALHHWSNTLRVEMAPLK